MEKKYKIHLPTEQFGFIESEITGEPEDAVEEYKSISRAWKGGEGWEEKRFMKFIDNMIAHKPNQGDPGELDEMSPAQKYVFNFVRKSLGRIS